MTRASRLFALACCLLAARGVLHVTVAADAAMPSRLSSLPFEIDGWQGRDDGRLDRETEQAVQADEYTLRTYVRGNIAVGLYVAYYATQQSGHTIHSPLNCLPGTGWTWLDRSRQIIAAPGGSIEVNRAIAQKDATQMLLYYWYQSRGRVVASDYRNKLLLMRDALALHRSDGALVRVIAPMAPGVDPSPTVARFVAATYPTLTHYLPE